MKKILIDGQTLHTPEVNRGIGRVFIEIAEELVCNVDTIDWYISISKYADLSCLSETLKRKVNLIEIPLGKDSVDYSCCLQGLIDKYDISGYWNPNPLMLNVLYPVNLEKVKVYVTMYDLIPVMMENEYFNKMDDSAQTEYLERLEAISEKSSKIIAISDAAKKDFQRFCPNAKARVVSVRIGLNPCSFSSSKYKISPTGRPYILYLGGFDYRKNMFKAVDAFSKLKEIYTQGDLDFYIVCDYLEEEKQRLMEHARVLGVSNSCFMLGKVSSAMLENLYANAQLFFFPSLYEGFGLPVLEAMASGTLCVVSRESSIPEASGGHAMLCDPCDTDQMANALHEVLKISPEDADKKRRDMIQYARSQSWKVVASHYRDIFQPMESAQRKRFKVAMVTPWPPETSGVASYSFSLTEKLSSYCDITLFTNNVKGIEQTSWLKGVYPVEEIKGRFDDFDYVIYQLGNSVEHHRDIYRVAHECPGVILIHDFILHSFLQHAYLGTDLEYLYESAWNVKSQPDDQHVAFKEISEKLVVPDVFYFPLNEDIIKRSQACIFLNKWAKKQFPLAEKIYAIPHGADIDSDLPVTQAILTLRKKHLINQEILVIGTFGFANRHKRTDKVIAAVAQLIQDGYPVKLLIAGEVIQEHFDIPSLCEEYGIDQEDVICTGYLDDESFQSYLHLCDIFVGLRKPSMGETSGVIWRALGIGKPCVISDYQQFSDFPDDICFKVDPGRQEVTLLVEYLKALCEYPHLRRQMSENAQAYVQNYGTFDYAASSLYSCLLDLEEAVS